MTKSKYFAQVLGMRQQQVIVPKFQDTGSEYHSYPIIDTRYEIDFEQFNIVYELTLQNNQRHLCPTLDIKSRKISDLLPYTHTPNEELLINLDLSKRIPINHKNQWIEWRDEGYISLKKILLFWNRTNKFEKLPVIYIVKNHEGFLINNQNNNIITITEDIPDGLYYYQVIILEKESPISFSDIQEKFRELPFKVILKLVEVSNAKS